MKSSVITVLFLYFGSIYSDFISDKKCGVVASDNPIHQHPWLALIEYHHNGHRALLRCGGTLIDSRHILTSAHCVEIVKSIPSVIIMPRLGEYNVSSRRDCVAGVCSDPIVRIVVTSMFLHPLFYRDHVSHDLVILVLETEAPYTDFIRPVCLPRRTLKLPTELYASGFGDIPNSDQPSKIKKNIRLPYYPRYPRAYERLRFYGHTLPKDGFCAGGEENIDTCNGDSGGPIIWVKQDGGLTRAELWGVIKGGTKRCGLKGKPGVYTSVLKNLLWIRKIIDITSPKQQNNGNTSEENENGEKYYEEKKNEIKPDEENLNSEKQNKEKHSDTGSSSQILSGSSHLLLWMLVLSVYLFC